MNKEQLDLLLQYTDPRIYESTSTYHPLACSRAMSDVIKKCLRESVEKGETE